MLIHELFSSKGRIELNLIKREAIVVEELLAGVINLRNAC
jgi:hypothetical protein